MTDSETDTETTVGEHDQTLRDRGAKIAAMVEDEEARVLAEEEAATVEHDAGFPCPVCGTAINLPDVPNQDPEKERCDVCGGWGMTATGSFLPDAAVTPCSKCTGRGWNNKVVQYIPATTPPVELAQEPQRVEVVSPDLPPLVLPDLTQLKVG